jgi:hypothetical protein
MSGGSFKGVNEKTTHFSHRFSNAVRPNTSSNTYEKKPLPRHHDEEAGEDIGAGSFEQASALHDCKYFKINCCKIPLILF